LRPVHVYILQSFHCNVTSKSQQWTKLGQVARGLLGIPAASTSSERSWLDCKWAAHPAVWWQCRWTVVSTWTGV